MSATIQFETIPNLECSSSSVYLANDSSLEVRVNYNPVPETLANQIERDRGIRDNVVLFMFGDLTITFCGENLLLHMIDSYTSNKNWLTKKINVPDSAINARCSLYVSGDDNRIRGDAEPVYIFDDINKRLMVLFSKNESDLYYRLTDNLIAGVAGKNLVSIFVEGIFIK